MHWIYLYRTVSSFKQQHKYDAHSLAYSQWCDIQTKREKEKRKETRKRIHQKTNINVETAASIAKNRYIIIIFDMRAGLYR